jgi:hypothetical protein
MKIIMIILFFLNHSHASGKNLYKSVFPDFDRIEEVKVGDPISDDPVNTLMLKVFKGQLLLGYVRKISTTTGCNSACLPVNYTSFYDSKGFFKKILSKSGLTKLNHAMFTKADYSNLEFLIVMAPKQFSQLTHPKEMTDAITGATKKEFKEVVVEGAAYSTYRIHLYNQHTLKEIAKFKK